MLSLALYEACTPAEDRALVGKFIEEYKRKDSALSLGSVADPLGNLMVESARQLSGVKQKTKKLNKPKKPRKLARGKGTPQRSKGRGRGGKVVRGRKGKSVPQRVTEVKTSERRSGRKEIKVPRKRKRSHSSSSKKKRYISSRSGSRSGTRSRSSEGKRDYPSRRRSRSDERRSKSKENEEYIGQVREGGVKNLGDGEVGLAVGHTDSTQNNAEGSLLEMKVREGSDRGAQLDMVAVIAGAGQDPSRTTNNEIGRRVRLNTQRSQQIRKECLRSKNP